MYQGVKTVKKYKSKKGHYPSMICEKFYRMPFPCFCPPQIGERRIVIRVDLKVKKVNDVVIHGQIKDCDTHEGISGAIVKAFYKNDSEELVGICHTFSGCEGYYMFRIPPEFKGKTLTIMAVKTNCPEELIPCECDKGTVTRGRCDKGTGVLTQMCDKGTCVTRGRGF